MCSEVVQCENVGFRDPFVDCLAPVDVCLAPVNVCYSISKSSSGSYREQSSEHLYKLSGAVLD